MRELKKLWATITTPCTVGGNCYQPGALVSVDSNTYRSLLADGLAVPSAGPLAAALATDKIRPHYEEPTP